MRNHPIVKAERCRVHVPGMPAFERCGLFSVPVGRERLKVIVSDGGGWDHVSVSLPHRCPTWDEMCAVRELFFADGETVMQLHVPRDRHVNFHPFCLHLWRPQSEAERQEINYRRGGEMAPGMPTPGPIPLPPSEMV